MRSLLTLGCLLALGGCAIIVNPNDDVQFKTVFSNDGVVGNGVLARESRTVGNVAALDVSGPLDVSVRVGPTASLEVEGDSNLLPMIRSEVSGGTLRLWVEGNVRTNQNLRVSYSAPQLTQIHSAGSARLSVSELNGAPLAIHKSGSGTILLAGRVGGLDIEQSGSGQINAMALQSGNANVNLHSSGGINLGQVRGDALAINANGSGRVQASGSVISVRALVRGSGGVDLAGLSSDQADLTSSGSGDITAVAKRSLIAQGSGSGRIIVYGNPAQRNVSGKNVQVLN
jgi:hypothetical protein